MSTRFGRRAPWLFLLASAIAAADMAGAAAQGITMKFGSATVNDAQHEWQKRYAERVNARSQGRLNVEIYVAGSLGSIPRQIEGVQLGTQEANVVPPAFMVGVEPRYQVLDAPGLFESGRHIARTISDAKFREAFFALGEGKGIKGIGLFYTAPTAVVTRKPIKSIDDLKGMKVRVFGSPMQTVPMARLGVAGAPMSLDEVLPALQTGALDGVFGSIAIFIPFKYWTLAKVMAQTNFSYVVSMTIVSKQWFDKLPTDLQRIVVEEGTAVDPVVNEWSFVNYENALKLWRENGGEVVTFSDAERADMMKRLAPIGDEVAKERPVIREMYDLTVKRAAATR
jgi:TRAP-type C4-dicarboxylate transport system substrate-binding protein